MLLYALSYQIFWCIIHHILIFNFAICANLCHKVMHHMHAQTGKCITPQLLLVAGFDSNLCRRRASPYSCPMPILTAWGCVHEPSVLFIEERNERRGPVKSPVMVVNGQVNSVHFINKPIYKFLIHEVAPAAYLPTDYQC